MKFLGLILGFCTVVSAAETKVPLVPTSALTADGHLGPDEWKGAEPIPLPGGGTIMVKQVAGMVWLAIVPEARHPTYVDLFLKTDDGVIHNLHASLQWGERVLSGRDWTDTEPAPRWGQPDGWRANRVRYSQGGRDAAEVTRASFEPYEAHEFCISRENFRGTKWRLRCEVRDFAGRMPDQVFPTTSTRSDANGWWQLRLG